MTTQSRRFQSLIDQSAILVSVQCHPQADGSDMLSQSLVKGSCFERPRHPRQQTSGMLITSHAKLIGSSRLSDRDSLKCQRIVQLLVFWLFSSSELGVVEQPSASLTIMLSTRLTEKRILEAVRAIDQLASAAIHHIQLHRVENSYLGFSSLYNPSQPGLLGCKSIVYEGHLGIVHAVEYVERPRPHV